MVEQTKESRDHQASMMMPLVSSLFSCSTAELVVLLLVLFDALTFLSLVF